MLASRADDGANQAGGYADTSGYQPVNTPDQVNDPMRWQPLRNPSKMRAEYWADGPGTETPPGHWCTFAQAASRARGYDLDQNVKLFFALSGALLDASIAAREEAGNSRRPGGIHFPDADQNGQALGAAVGADAWARA